MPNSEETCAEIQCQTLATEEDNFIDAIYVNSLYSIDICFVESEEFYIVEGLGFQWSDKVLKLKEETVSHIKHIKTGLMVKISSLRLTMKKVEIDLERDFNICSNEINHILIDWEGSIKVNEPVNAKVQLEKKNPGLLDMIEDAIPDTSKNRKRLVEGVKGWWVWVGEHKEDSKTSDHSATLDATLTLKQIS